MRERPLQSMFVLKMANEWGDVFGWKVLLLNLL